MQRPLNIPPDMWKKRFNNGQNIKQEKKQNKKVQLDGYTKLNNSIDLISQGIYLFKKAYKQLIFQQFTKQQLQDLQKINDLFEQALIPYTIDVVELFQKVNNKDIIK